MNPRYTTQLQAGLGMNDETRILLELWQPGMSTSALQALALQSGRFPQMSARRLQNVVTECFAPRYLTPHTASASGSPGSSPPAHPLKALLHIFTPGELDQLFFLYTCRANAILHAFVREVYWSAYASGRAELANEEARTFVARANQAGLTTRPWSPSTCFRVAGYLTGCCADFGLLERGARSIRHILPFRIEARVAAFLAYDLHFAGQGDTRLLGDLDWALFGLDAQDVLTELRRLALKGLVIVQSAGAVTRISWQAKHMEALIHVLAES